MHRGLMGGGSTVGGVFGFTGPLRPERCGGVGMGGGVVKLEKGCCVGEGLLWMGGQSLRTALYTTSISLENSFCELYTWETSELKGSKST